MKALVEAKCHGCKKPIVVARDSCPYAIYICAECRVHAKSLKDARDAMRLHLSTHYTSRPK